jgi:FMN phosphatase YigB (HAD superfamily)
VKIRAAIFDVYGTLLQVEPVPADADAKWHKLWKQMLQTAPEPSRVEFSSACSRVIARHHERARARGIAVPEVNWPAVVAEVVPQFSQLPPEARDEFIWRQMETWHATTMKEMTATTLGSLGDARCLLGVASNAQAYTLRELQQGLHRHGLGLEVFHPNLCFWSFQHGFSKPDPHVFQILTARLATLGISEDETLMVGDSLDNDIAPARLHGWRTWQLCAPGQQGDGPFEALLAALKPEKLPA